MKNTIRMIGIIVIVIIAFSITACKNDPDPDQIYKIGDTGPGGGKVFYDKGNNTDGWRYLEVSITFLGDLPWASSNIDVAGLTYWDSANIGLGKSNTAAIIAAHLGDTSANNAAKACVDYRGPNDKTDWFLPSVNELTEIWEQKTYLGITFTTDRVWSSSQSNTNQAYYLQTANGGQNNVAKDEIYSVLAVRAFK